MELYHAAVYEMRWKGISKHHGNSKAVSYNMYYS